LGNGSSAEGQNGSISELLAQNQIPKKMNKSLECESVVMSVISDATEVQHMRSLLALLTLLVLNGGAQNQAKVIKLSQTASECS